MCGLPVLFLLSCVSGASFCMAIWLYCLSYTKINHGGIRFLDEFFLSSAI
uniref:Uncharacterized protein n=1 Tax=Rhizophora mucronata TaxID=61149 RepID=A0A2P2JA49_RHIMU